MRLGNYYVNFVHTENSTSCTVKTDDDHLVNSSVSKCHPCDSMDKKKGRKISMARAISVLPRVERIGIWNDYKTKCKLI